MAAKCPGPGLAHIRWGSLPFLCCACQDSARAQPEKSFQPPRRVAQNHNWERKLAGGHEISAGDHITGWSVGVRCGARRWLRDDVGEPGCPSPHVESVPQGGHRAQGLHLCSCTTPARGSPETACAFLGEAGGYSGGAWKDDNVRGPKLELLLVALLGPIRSPVRASVFLSIKWEWW